MARRQHLEPQRENNERWLITYADMITLLMVFFIVLYAGSISDTKKYEMLASSLSRAFNMDVATGSETDGSIPDIADRSAIIESIRHDVERIEREFDGLIVPGIGSGGLEVAMNREGVRLSLYGNLLFDSGKATLKDEAIAVLDRTASVLAASGYQIRVEGHTDDVPISTPLYPSNWELSTARATAVVRYLAERAISAARLQAVGYADTRPVAPNTTRDERMRNRRVDIQIIYPAASESLRTAEFAQPVPVPRSGE